MTEKKPIEYKEINCDLDLPESDITFSHIFDSNPSVFEFSEPILKVSSSKEKPAIPDVAKPILQEVKKQTIPKPKPKPKPQRIVNPDFDSSFQNNSDVLDPDADPLLSGRSEYFSNPTKGYVQFSNDNRPVYQTPDDVIDTSESDRKNYIQFFISELALFARGLLFFFLIALALFLIILAIYYDIFDFLVAYP